MGRFNCVECGCSYYSKRFFWEDWDETESLDAIKNEQCEGECSSDIPYERMREPESIQQPQRIEDFMTSPRPEADADKAAGPKNTAEFVPFIAASEIETCSTCTSLTDTPLLISEDKDNSKCLEVVSMNDMAPRADVVRVSGTCANILGAAAPALHYVLAPVSAVGGAVGASAGFAQLREGLSAPSGITDPHLVTKGGVTASVGTTCMALGIGSAAVPGLFIAALVLGVCGLGAATTIDATMDGLCPHCTNDGTRRRTTSDI